MRRVAVRDHVRGMTEYRGQCVHRWQGGRRQICLSCPATCTRDKRLEICEFDAEGQIQKKSNVKDEEQGK